MVAWESVLWFGAWRQGLLASPFDSPSAAFEQLLSSACMVSKPHVCAALLLQAPVAVPIPMPTAWPVPTPTLVSGQRCVMATP